MIITSIEYDRPGKQQGFLQVPYSHNLGGWANVMIPITVIANGAGPTVLFPLGDVVIDIHSGGRSVQFVACAHMHIVAGSEFIPASVHRIAHDGLRNVLVHVGLLKGVVQTRDSLGKPPSILTQALNREDYVLAPESGIFELCGEIGEPVKRGDIVGAIHHLERPDRAAEKIVSQSEGYLVATRAPCLTQQGDCVAVIAKEVTADEVLDA